MNETACRRLVWARAGSGEALWRRCERCGSFEQGSLHHRVKRSHGGRWTPQNIVWVCGSGTTGCHGEIESGRSSAGGWALPSGTDPATEPIEHHVWGRVRLDGEGGYVLCPQDADF